MTATEYGPCVLCVLSETQQDAYRAELDSLHQAGVNLLFQPSPDDGLQQIGRIRPRMVVVGMNVDMMEGLEFVALLMRRYPEFDREIIVLPDKDDPFPPVLQRRDPATGRSTTEHLDLDTARGRILAAVRADTSPGEAHTEEAAYAAAVQEFAGPSLTASGRNLREDVDREANRVARESAAPPFETAVDRPPAVVAAHAPMQPSSSRTKWVLVAGGAVLAGATAAALLFGDSEPAQTPAVTPDAAVEAPPETAPDPPPETGQRPTPAEPAPPAPSVDLTELVGLPINYEPGEATPADVANEDALDTTLAALRDALAADPDARVEVGGHTSEEGSPETNQKLGRRRAQVAADWLVERGIPEDRIDLENYAASKPAASNDTPEGRSQNRRVTIRLVETH